VRVAFKQGVVSITNVGPGIPEGELSSIFERFYKSRSEANKNGTGLGLAIAKQIAIRHGIGISVRSIQGGETTFWFDFNYNQKKS
jgi:signal transduction histidine kinase